MEPAQLDALLRHRVPDRALPLFMEQLRKSRFTLRVVRGRSSKLGDFRYPRLRGEPPRITINENLNPYAFTITLVHEAAHLRVWENYNRSASRPHGVEWKREYRMLMELFLHGAVFPEDLGDPIRRHIRNPAATTTGDPVLLRAIRRYDGEVGSGLQGGSPSAGRERDGARGAAKLAADRRGRASASVQKIYLEDLAHGALFSLEGYGSFEKGRKLRKRYECVQMGSRKLYRIHPLAEVELLGNTKPP